MMLPSINSLPQLADLETALRTVCERNHIIRLAVYGSMVREDYGPESDLDILVEFEDGHVPGFGFFDLQDELSELFGRTVDLNTWGFLSPHIHANVAREAVIIYDEAGQKPQPLYVGYCQQASHALKSAVRSDLHDEIIC